jgi:hypothetical protein
MSTNTDNNVRLVTGFPQVGDFASRRGSPLVIDTNTGFAYFMRGEDILPIQLAPASVVGAFDDGFDGGFS